MGDCRPFHNLSPGETGDPLAGTESSVAGAKKPQPRLQAGECGGGKTPPQISRRKDQAGSPGTEEKTSRLRHIHSMAFTPGLTSGILIAYSTQPAPYFPSLIL